MKDFFTLKRNIQLRLIMTFIGVLAYFTVSGSMTIYYNQYMGAEITGVLLIIASIGSFLVGLLAGHLSDLRGRRPNMLLGMAISMTGAVLAVICNTLFFNPWLTFVGMVLEGFGYGFFGTGAEAMLVDVTTPDDRKLVYSLNYWLLNMAAVIGSGLSGWLFRDYLYILLIGILVANILNFLIVLLFVEETFDPKNAVHEQETNIFKAYRQVSKDHTFMIFAFATLFTTVIFGQSNYYIPVHLARFFTATQILGITVYGQRMLTVIAIINSVCVIAFLTRVRKLTQSFSNKLGFGLGASLMGTGWIIVFMGRSFWIEIAGTLINVLGELVFVPFGQALMADLMNPEQAGVYNGTLAMQEPIAATICGLSVSLSPFLGDMGMSGFLLLVTLLSVLPALIAIDRHEKSLSRSHA